MVLDAAERTKQRLADFADGKLAEKPLPDSYHAVVQDIGAFGVFIQELRALRKAAELARSEGQ